MKKKDIKKMKQKDFVKMLRGVVDERHIKSKAEKKRKRRKLKKKQLSWEIF